MEELKELIKIRSDNNCDEVLSYICESLKDKVKEILYVKNKEDCKKNLLIGINTELKNIEPIVLSGHIDTVSAKEDQWDSNSYTLTIKDDKAYGLGIIDMKCFTASVIKLIDSIFSVNVPIVLALTSDEETNLYGINTLIDKMKELNIKPRFTIIGEPTSMKINNISNGCFEYKVEVFGKACHSSQPQNGINSICVIAKIVTYIEDLAKQYTDLTMSCDLIEGGNAINKVADYASMCFDIRTINLINYDEVIELIINKIKELEQEYGAKISFKETLRIPPLNCNSDNVKLIAKQLGTDIEAFKGGCEAGYYTSYSGEAILYGVGDLSLAHQCNEYMIIKNYQLYNDKLLEMLDIVSKIYY